MLKRIDSQVAQSETILEIFEALDDKTRQEIVLLFRTASEYRATEIAQRFRLSRPTISHHLNLLRRAGILTARKKGREIWFSFNKNYVIATLKTLISYLEGCC